MDNEEFTKEVMRAHSSLLRYALLLTHDSSAAEELLQSSLVRAYIKREMFISGTNFASWTRSIMHNIFLNSIENKNHGILSSYPFDADTCNIISSHSADINISAAEIECMIESLPVEISLPLKLYIRGYMYREISEMLHLPLTTVKNRIHIARKRLREQLRDYYEE